jgi:hypothetical protein
MTQYIQYTDFMHIVNQIIRVGIFPSQIHTVNNHSPGT